MLIQHQAVLLIITNSTPNHTIKKDQIKEVIPATTKDGAISGICLVQIRKGNGYTHLLHYIDG